ncbi:4,5-dihydroxyphthalate decarboxylase [Salinisphaera aquimarina]|uniref:4,5-dihydroxyphthalate decarboxylase n=1 Tax=Salinisphaera aquimarina TaxID=2094031 RepID=A0ABV7ETT4_9GAMM
MNTKALDVACWKYDRVAALMNGEVTIEGADASFHTARIVTEIFESMIRGQAYDVSELGMTYFLRTFSEGLSPFLALPIFPNRAFRHSAIYVNKHSGIQSPADLASKTIGELALYSHDAGIVAKGILADEYGFDPAQSQWLIGGIDFPMKPIDFVARPHPSDVDVSIAAPDTDLGKMLDTGEIDALVSADVPECVLQGSPNVGRLFADYPAVERDYFDRTGIFPIMHTVVVTRELAEQEPDVVRAVYSAFCRAKDMAAEALHHGMTFNNMATMVPWLTDLLEKNRALMGDDGWPYGIAANRPAVEAMLRYHHEQGITDRTYAVEDIFVPYLLDT